MQIGYVSIEDAYRFLFDYPHLFYEPMRTGYADFV
jgi:hypothetical protein